ncbi:hypothetical protein E2542_SST10089 [Spatholobus suberectus]|nr:hypothetical protein E2542_SST10089 [Spatholobus suberectus]
MRMRLVVIIALTLLMLASSCLATDKKTLVANMQEDPEKQIREDEGEHSNDNNDQHKIPLKEYGYGHDSNTHQIPGTGGPGQRTVDGHFIPRKHYGKPGPEGNA